MAGPDIKTAVETELAGMLDNKKDPDDGRLRLLKLAIGYLAVKAKLEEGEYGEWFKDAEEAIPGEEPRTRKRKKRARFDPSDLGEPAPEGGGYPDSGFDH